MSREEQVEKLTAYMANFIGYTAKVLPDDVIAKLDELAEREDGFLPKVIYQTMKKNQKLAKELDRPSCQDTGVLQFWVKCGTAFPLIGDLEALLKEAVIRATFQTPLRHNSVETFDEYNTGKNVGKGTPTVFWDIVPDSDKCEIYTYMAGGGCSLPGKAMVLMPGAGYEGVTKFVMDVMTTYGLNACPPLLVGVGVATSVETAALLSKKALMRPIGSHNENERAAYMEKLLENGINSIGLGPQGMGGKYSVMGVHIENTARHPSTIGVAVSLSTKKLASNTATETASLLKKTLPFFRSSLRFLGVAFSVFELSAKAFSRSPYQAQYPPQLREHAALQLQQEFVDRRQEQKEQKQPDDHLQLDIDDKGVDLRDRLHQHPHAYLSQQLRCQDRHSQLYRQEHTGEKQLNDIGVDSIAKGGSAIGNQLTGGGQQAHRGIVSILRKEVQNQQDIEQ